MISTSYTRPKIQNIKNKFNKINQTENKILNSVNAVKNIVKNNNNKKKIKKPQQNYRPPRQLGLADTNPYFQALVSPERVFGCKVPRQFGLSTITCHRHITLPFVCSTPTVGTNGKFFLFFQPYSLFDAANNLTTFGITNEAGYDGATNLFACNGQAISYTCPAGSVFQYRLVSCSLQIIPQVPALTANGKMGGAVIPFNTIAAVAPAAQLDTGNPIMVFSNIENYDYYAEADLCQFEALRMAYYPADVHDYETYNINSGDGVAGSNQETTFVAYGTGIPPGTAFNAEIYLNFELTPAPGSILTGMTSMNTDMTDPSIETMNFKRQPALICHSFRTAQPNHRLVNEPTAQVTQDNIVNNNAFYQKPRRDGLDPNQINSNGGMRLKTIRIGNDGINYAN